MGKKRPNINQPSPEELARRQAEADRRAAGEQSQQPVSRMRRSGSGRQKLTSQSYPVSGAGISIGGR